MLQRLQSRRSLMLLRKHIKLCRKLNPNCPRLLQPLLKNQVLAWSNLIQVCRVLAGFLWYHHVLTRKVAMRSTLTMWTIAQIVKSISLLGTTGSSNWTIGYVPLLS